MDTHAVQTYGILKKFIKNTSQKMALYQHLWHHTTPKSTFFLPFVISRSPVQIRLVAPPAIPYVSRGCGLFHAQKIHSEICHLGANGHKMDTLNFKRIQFKHLKHIKKSGNISTPIKDYLGKKHYQEILNGEASNFSVIFLHFYKSYIHISLAPYPFSSYNSACLLLYKALLLEKLFSCIDMDTSLTNIFLSIKISYTIG